MIPILPSPTVTIKKSLKEKVENFLTSQCNYSSQDKVFILMSFQDELRHNMYSEGLTNENLLLGLELNNYIEQVRKPKDQGLKLQTVTYQLK